MAELLQVAAILLVLAFLYSLATWPSRRSTGRTHDITPLIPHLHRPRIESLDGPATSTTYKLASGAATANGRSRRHGFSASKSTSSSASSHARAAGTSTPATLATSASGNSYRARGLRLHARRTPIPSTPSSKDGPSPITSS